MSSLSFVSKRNIGLIQDFAQNRDRSQLANNQQNNGKSGVSAGGTKVGGKELSFGRRGPWEPTYLTLSAGSTTARIPRSKPPCDRREQCSRFATSWCTSSKGSVAFFFWIYPLETKIQEIFGTPRDQKRNIDATDETN